MKKILKLIAAFSIMFTIVGCSSTETTPEVTPEVEVSQEQSSIHVIIIDASQEEETVLFDEQVAFNDEVATLADLLTSNEQFELVSEETEYGLSILGLMGVEGNWDKGPWWLYESENNEQCVAAGYCDGVSNLTVSDGDVFTFRLTSEY